MKRCPVPGQEQKNPDVWVLRLEQYLPSSLRHRDPADTDTDPASSTPTTQGTVAQTIELNNLLFHARVSGNLDLLAHLGFRLNNWAAVDHLMDRLLNTVDALDEVSVFRHPFSNDSWGHGSDVSLDQLTDQDVDSFSPQPRPRSDSPSVSELTTLDSLTERPFADDHSKRLMAEVWQSLGSIVLDASEASPNESKVAMSYVFRILARLHHSGAVSDRVYKYIPPAMHQTSFRPPGMHLLSTHIMNVLSDAAWLMHEAEVAARAAAAGEDSPFLPFKMGIRELGPEVWLEFILWCCVEHGHIQEGAWLVHQIQSRTGDQAWKFQSWGPLLQHPGTVWETNIDLEESWRHPASEDLTPSRRKRANPAPFNGLGKRTISLEVAASLLDNLPNLIYLGLGYRGVSTTALLRQVPSLRFAITPSMTGEQLLPTTKEALGFTVRALESRGFNPEADPQAFEGLLRATPHVVPPWDADPSCLSEEDMEQLRPSQIYNESWALAGLIEYNIRSYSSKRMCGDAVNAFEWLQEVVDSSKMRRIGEFFSSRSSLPDIQHLPTLDAGSLASLHPFEASMPQLSTVTLAQLLDLVTVSRAFAFGEWLLFSDDIDGPAVSRSAYGNQALAPSIIRFAAATKNSALCESVVQSLAQPLSVNTLRALLNFRIAMGQWGRVVLMLEYLRDYRLKSWGHSNVTTLAAEIIRMDHALQQPQQDPAAAERQEQSLAQAKAILLRILGGEFNESHVQTDTTFQARSLYGLRRIFLSIPGALRDIAATANVLYAATTRTTVPYIPATAFHTLLSAVVDTQGSAAGKRLWNQWCLDIKAPAHRRLQEGGISRLYLNQERNPAKGDPHFDAVYFKQVRKKAIQPNLNTVRIIAQAAVSEYNDHESHHASSSSTSLDNPATGTLEFCIQRFEAFGLRRREINREVGGHFYRKRREAQKRKKQQEQKDGV
ncbi:hypothetical protein EYZ11_011725 [Aspergillus tanneri]|nr:hypothetical protein EYZ11_011725 [Aspergillus tanneri]